MTRRYHIGFGPEDIDGIDTAILCGDPDRASRVARDHLALEAELSTNRGLNAYIGRTPGGRRVVSATSGMGAPSTSIVVNELAQVGIRHVVRVGTTGSIQPHVRSGSVVISRAALCRQGAAEDIAPTEYPAAASPFWTLALTQAARALGVDWHVGLTASVDTFYEGQERTETSFNPTLIPSRRGLIEAYKALRVLNFEMESGTLFKLASVYGLGVGCVCAVIAARDEAESVALDVKARAERDAIRVAVAAIDGIDPEWLDERHRW
ncbi:MAG: nucleoside phosphorylase [Alphaproteobacteria bacterium]|nr:nucleoside phosphorylase [Alphaproteobacteria bacterium]